MVVGYSAFQTKLEIKGTSKVTSNWDIEITNVTEGTPTGSGENTVAPFWNKTTASMEANLYDKGDAMEYDVTIENKGTIDAKLNDILTNIENSNSEAVLITFSGYTKGEVLKSKTSKVVHVKIEYNPEYEGGETSSEVEINFDYVQNNNEENNPDNQYLLTYDYNANGGTNVELKEEYLTVGSNVDLTNVATKEGWTFVGWNTNKDAKVGLESYQMPNSNITLYAIYTKTLKVTYQKGENIESIGKVEDSCNIYNNNTSCEITLPSITPNKEYIVDGWYNGSNKVGNPNDKYSISADTTLTSKSTLENISVTISTTSTTNSITVVANAYADSGIAKYEYSKDGGKTWIASSSNTYTFTKLTQTTNYNIMVRVTSNTGKTSTINKNTTTSTITKPTFKETSSSGNNTVTINYPIGCGTKYTCTYQKDNGSNITVNSQTISINFNQNGNIVAKVTDGTNSVSSSYNTVIKYSITTSKNNTVNLTVTPNTTLASANSTVSFTVPSSSSYTYQGAYVYNTSGSKVMTLDSNTKTFNMPSYAVRIAPIFKHNDLTLINRDTKNDTFIYKNILYDKLQYSSFTITEVNRVFTLASNSAHFWDFGLVHTSKTYDIKYYDYITFDNNAEVKKIGSQQKTPNSANFGVLKSLDKGLVYSFTDEAPQYGSGQYYNNTAGMYVRVKVNDAREVSKLDLTKLEDQNSKYYIGFEFSTNYESSNLYMWSVILHGKTFYS